MFVPEVAKIGGPFLSALVSKVDWNVTVAKCPL